MQRKMILRWSAAVVSGLLALAACNDDNSVAPKIAPDTPRFLQNTPLNGGGACLALDAFNAGFTSGVTSATTLADPNQHCTSNDIRVAHADLIEWSPDSTTFFPVPQGGLTCLEGDTLFVHLHSDIHETATSERTDIGLWISTDGGNARTGSCNQYNLVAPPINASPDSGVYNIDGDHCGDMNKGDSTEVDIGTIRVVCQTASPTSTSLHVGACLGWTQPGGDQVCPQNNIEDATHYRYGTTPGTTAKCNCEGFDIPVTVQRTAKLEVVKACTPTNDAGTFDLLIDGSNSFANNVSCGGSTGAQTLSAGTNVSPGAVHTFGEGDFNTAAYTSSYACVNRGTATSRGSGTSLGPNNITLQPNDDVVCTYTNVRQPNLTLVKVVTNDNGGTKTASDFPLTATGPVTISGVSGTTAVTARVVSTGTYALTEQTQANYAASSWSCTGGTQSGANITLGAGNSVTCTISNNDVGPTLTLVKTISNDNGGAKTLTDFPLTATGPVTISGVSGTTAVTGRTVSAGSYALTEQTQTGYTPSSWSCTGGTQSGANIGLALGGCATCTINNDDNAPGLTLVKVVTNNNGGTKTLSDFPLTASGPMTISGVSGTTSVTNRLVIAGAYALSEQTQAGYAATSWSCTGNGTQSGANITIGLGGAATCTIGNNDIGPHLTLVKVITNNNGGTKVGSDFLLTATGPVPPSCAPGSVVGATGSPSVTNAEMCSGTYALSEQTQAGYTPSTWSCTGGTQSGSNITLGLASSATCTIGNDDIAPHLTLVKVVTNDNGGTKTLSDFPLTASGPVTISGVSGSTAVTGRAVNAGSYALTEQTQAGYTPSSWSCSGGTQTGANIALALGGSATCTISNNDIAPKLVIKKVVKGAGSTFGFTATGAGIVSPFNLNPPTDGADSVVYANATAGLFSISEDAKSGYLLTDLGCSDQSTVYDPATTRTVTDTLSLGETVTCTFVNEAIALTTRTQGFWATHESLTNAVWVGLSAGGHTFSGVSDKTLCGRTLGTPEVLGGFWSSISHETDRTKRSSLDQKRMQLLQQLLAAILNNAAFGSSPTGMSIAAAKDAYCGTDETLIKNAMTAMAQFNESGDNGLFTPGVSANGKQAKNDANLGFWDTLP